MKKAYQKQCLIETVRNGAKLCHTMTRLPGLCFSCSLPFILFNQDNGQVNKGIFMRGRMYILSITYLFPNSFLQYMLLHILLQFLHRLSACRLLSFSFLFLTQQIFIFFYSDFTVSGFKAAMGFFFQCNNFKIRRDLFYIINQHLK